MGKVTEKVRVTNLLDPSQSLEIEAVVDTGATMLVLPKDIVDRLGLRKVEEVRVRYANNNVETKQMLGVITLELQERAGNFAVFAEVEGAQPLIGRIVLERLHLVIEPSTSRVMPNPRSPEMPMVEIPGVAAFGRSEYGVPQEPV
jgi:clan AA aspartic protease